MLSILIRLKLWEILAGVPHYLGSLIRSEFFDLDPEIVNFLVQVVNIFRDDYESQENCWLSQLLKNYIKVLPIFLNNLFAIIDNY